MFTFAYIFSISIGQSDSLYGLAKWLNFSTPFQGVIIILITLGCTHYEMIPVFEILQQFFSQVLFQ